MALTLDDKNHYDVYKQLKIPLQEHSFAFQFIAPFYKDISIEKINDNTCIFLTFNNKRYLWGPPLPGNNLQETLDIAFERGISSVAYIPHELLDTYSKLSNFTVEEQNQDYIYLRETIANLSGDDLKKKRNLRNFFVKNNEYYVEEYRREKHQSECKKLLEKWKAEKIAKNQNEQEKIEQESDACIMALQHAHDVLLEGIVVYVNDRIEAFTFGEVINNILSVQIEKANVKIKGLPQFIYSEFAKKFNCKYINAGEDWDVAYLKKIKESYKPIIKNKIYKLVRQ